MTSQWDHFFESLEEYVQVLRDNEAFVTQARAEEAVQRIDNYLSVLSAICERLEEDEQEDNDISDLLVSLQTLHRDLQKILERWVDIEVGIVPSIPSRGISLEKQYTGSCGRPKYVLRKEQVLFLRDLKFSWTQIASMYGICRRTLFNIHCELEMVGDEFRGFTCISDTQLMEEIKDIKVMMPETGQSMVKGLLQARGIHVSMVRVRNCVRQIDPINTALRWATPQRRRIYSVPHPNFLWHIDGNHKLIRYMYVCAQWHFVFTTYYSSFFRWRLVVLGGVDGYSRFIVYLKCSNNNRSSTVLDLFEGAVQQFGMPDRVRSD